MDTSSPSANPPSPRLAPSAANSAPDVTQLAGRSRDEPIFVPPASYLSAKRPSWAPSLPESTEEEDEDDDHLRMSRSKSKSRPKARSRSTRYLDESLAFSPLDGGASALSGLLSGRRPSLGHSATSLPELHDRARKRRRTSIAETSSQHELPLPPAETQLPEGFLESSSPEDGGNFRRSLQIDMKDLVGDAVGNMSISPASRDVVLAARRGLFIIDLEAPLEVPRFLPQGGTWDVADVQWNPHPSRAQYIVSTSSEKMLIWNLHLGGKTSIEHILKSHYRAITDINWHTSECDLVASTGIDSWVWAWDIREPRKPIFGLCGFNAGGTQVKWNRNDPNILASSHANEVLIWDRRKGSLPITQIRAHNSKIYGIDWSHTLRNEIITCSLDKTIKTWDITGAGNPYTASNIDMGEAKSVIRTTYPVWRARSLPFGEGLLSLAQRGETALEMYSKGNSQTPTEIFEGHTDVVKEFVWRKSSHGGPGGQDDFQLITWSKDRTLRFWPIEPEIMQKVGYDPPPSNQRSRREPTESQRSFRNPPEARATLPALSAPIGNRSILAEVRANPPKRRSTILSQQADLDVTDEMFEATPTQTSGIVMAPGGKHGETMSRGGIGGKNVARMDAFAWLSNVKVGSRRGSSSGADSRANSAEASRLNSRSRPPSAPDALANEISKRMRSVSRSRATDERRESEGAQSLQDEITTVLTKLSQYKIKLEKHDLTKKRSCTLGLHGPWGETSSVFIRVTFNFPREYPYGIHPEGTPTVDLERNPLISMKDRAYMLKHLKFIRERKRPCLEACLRFLLCVDDEQPPGRDDSSSESSEDEDNSKTREVTLSMLKTTKNLGEPRVAQGAFGPDGQFVHFRRPPRRILRQAEKNGAAEGPEDEEQESQQKRIFQSPSLVSDAIRRLSLAATDCVVKPFEQKRPENGNDIIRIMTNLLTVSQYNARRDSESMKDKRSLVPSLQSAIVVNNTNKFDGLERILAVDYVFQADSLRDVCEKNANAAHIHGRYDHERAFRSLQTLFVSKEQSRDADGPASFASDSLAQLVVTQIYSEFSRAKDLQMLAMISTLILQTVHGLSRRQFTNRKKSDISSIPLSIITPKVGGGMDYFSLTRTLNGLSSPVSPTWPRLPSSPIGPPPVQSISSSTSSRGSWSSLFNTGTMRQFMNGVQDSFKEGLATPVATHSEESTPLPIGEKKTVDPSSSAKRYRIRKDSGLKSPLTVSKSWNEPVNVPSKVASLSFSSTGRRPNTLLRAASSTPFIHEELIVFEPPSPTESRPLFEPQLLNQFLAHVHKYAEFLFRWQLYYKRLELLKSINREDIIDKTEQHSIGIIRKCLTPGCYAKLPEKSNSCRECHNTQSPMKCTICRLPVKGLSRSCLHCYHVTHVACWNLLDVPFCPTGCGCFCGGYEGLHLHTRPSTLQGLTPPISLLMLPAGIT